jgi:hypothetical protein
MSADGSHLIYSTFLGGSSTDFAHGIAVDSSKNVYVVGEAYSTDFPLVNPFQSHSLGPVGFVSKLSADGSTLVYSTLLGGSLEGACNAIAVTSGGEAVVAGRTYSTDFPVLNAFQPSHAADNGNGDAFLTEFAASGSTLIFSTYLGGNSNDMAQGVALDGSGNIYVAGTTSSTDFPTTSRSYQPSYSPNSLPTNSFLSKFSPSGTNLTYSTYLAASQSFGVAVDASGDAYLTGVAGESGFPVTPGAFQTVQGGGFSLDAFVSEFDPTGSSLVYSTFLGGNNNEYGFAIAVDSSNDAYVTGETFSQNFPLRYPVQVSSYSGVPSAFVSELSSNGSQLLFSTHLGGGALGYGGTMGSAIAIDSSENIVVVGSTSTPDFPAANAFQPTLRGSQNAFISKLLNQPAPSIALNASTISFTPEIIGVSGLAQPITITNVGTARLTIFSLNVTGDFSVQNGCTSQIAPNGTCTVNVTFTPTVFGQRSGQLTIFNNATLTPVFVPLSGSGQDFMLVGTPGLATVSPGSTVTLSLSLTPEGGFSQAVSLSCAGAPANSTCTIAPPSVVLDGTHTATATVTITTTAATAALPSSRPYFVSRAAARDHYVFALGVIVVAFSLLVNFALARDRKMVITTFALLLVCVSVAACGGGASASRPSSAGGGGSGIGTGPGSYNIIVTGTSIGNLSHAVEFGLTVN